MRRRLLDGVGDVSLGGGMEVIEGRVEAEEDSNA